MRTAAMSLGLLKHAVDYPSLSSFSTNSRMIVAHPFSSSQCFTNRFSGGSNKSIVPSFPEIKFGGRIVYRRTAEEVERAAMELLNFVEGKKSTEGNCILGLDIEWRPTFRKVSTLWLSMRTMNAQSWCSSWQGCSDAVMLCGDNSCCYAFHIFHSQIPKTLKCLLEDPATVMVGVGIAADATKIRRDHNVHINNLLDLSHLANEKLGGERRTWSLSSLTESLMCRLLPKPNFLRLGNWEVKVLSKDQLTYAVNDAYVSWCLYQVLNNLGDPADNERVDMLKNVNDNIEKN